MSKKSLAIEMKAISKRFPLVLANDSINFNLKWGEVHALVGENGAGKSTLMKILYGMQQPDSGEIITDGQKTVFTSPTEAIKHGIGMVHQHFMLIETLSVLDNIILGSEPNNLIGIDYKKARQSVQELVKKFGFDLNIDTLIEKLPVGLQQKVEILKTIYRKAKILILDEPTAVLTPLETDELFKFLRDFAASGNSVIFISHKLKEVITVSDRISVMRNGKMIGTVDNKGITPPEIAKMMVGRDVILQVDKDKAQPKEVFLDINGVSVNNKVKNVSFSVRSGEIVGISGVEGNGQNELIEAITGLIDYKGQITYLGHKLKQHNPATVRQIGLSHIPEDRNERGLVLEFSTAENLILGDHANFSRLGLFNSSVIEAKAEHDIERYDVRPRSTSLLAKSYSGGNAQKIVIARELEREPKILIAAQPTRGVDIGAIEFIHQVLVEARDRGLAVLLVSADLNEVMSLSDRILVMYEGEIVGELSSEEATEEKLGLLMAGLQRQASEHSVL